LARRRNTESTESVRGAANHPVVVELLRSDRVTARRLGLIFDLNLSDNLQRTLFLLGTYEPEYLAFLESEVCPGDTYIDVGAHIGLDAFVVARKLAGRGGSSVSSRRPTALGPFGRVQLGTVSLRR